MSLESPRKPFTSTKNENLTRLHTLCLKNDTALACHNFDVH